MFKLPFGCCGSLRMVKRHGRDLGFSPQDRKENVRRVSEVGEWLNHLEAKETGKTTQKNKQRILFNRYTGIRHKLVQYTGAPSVNTHETIGPQCLNMFEFHNNSRDLMSCPF